jgi:hypothetical protein
VHIPLREENQVCVVAGGADQRISDSRIFDAIGNQKYSVFQRKVFDGSRVGICVDDECLRGVDSGSCDLLFTQTFQVLFVAESDVEVDCATAKQALASVANADDSSRATESDG